MKINSIQSQQYPSFGTIIRGDSIKKVLKTKHPSNIFMYELDKIELSLGILGVDSKQNVDVILNHAPREGFFGIISSKISGIPNSFSSKCKISKEYGDIITFNNWVNEWDEFFSRESCSVSEKSQNAVQNMVKKN